ncbi:hypothetical protein V6N11_033006 [Hibiscus sabdariffa]|uniref:BHLH domain-containing protein n=1 Tax=Hibiscus sabdariffa TaxID=183260 RepID=A0ABR1ZZ99_9ROSI
MRSSESSSLQSWNLYYNNSGIILKKLMETADCYYLQQNQQLGCGSMRYRSGPTTLLQNHVNGTSGVTGFDEYGGFRSSSSHEMETLFMLCGDGTPDMQEYEDKSVKKEYQIQRLLLPMQAVVGTDVGLEKAHKVGNANASNLVRQSSSPPQFFSNHALDNGFNGTKGEPTDTSRLYKNHISFSSMPSSYSKPMPQIAQVENQSLGNSNGGNGPFSPNLFCGLSNLQTRTGDCIDRDYSTGLTHHLSLPKTYEETDVVETFWQFQGSVACKIRAKRGCATHPRSIAERVRRTRISERMRKLQGLFPNIDKQTKTADMLDMAVEYIKDLQRQVKTLREAKAKCSC